MKPSATPAAANADDLTLLFSTLHKIATGQPLGINSYSHRRLCMLHRVVLQYDE